jgi:hypothetical protein
MVSLALSVPKFLETRFVWTPLNSTANETDGISIDGGDNDTQVSIL